MAAFAAETFDSWFPKARSEIKPPPVILLACYFQQQFPYSLHCQAAVKFWSMAGFM